MALTRTSFHPVFIDKMRAAMREAVAAAGRDQARLIANPSLGTRVLHGRSLVTNRRGKVVAFLSYHPDEGFRIFTFRRRDITALVTSIIQTI